MKIESRKILITGGNRGLGFKTAEILGSRGHRIVITTRNQKKSDDTCSKLRAFNIDVEGVVLDLASQVSIKKALVPLAMHGPYDVILHNAGVLLAPEQQRKTVDDFEQTLQVNALGPLWLTEALLGSLASPARLIFVGSMLHEPGSRGGEVELNLDDPNGDKNYQQERAYKNSKLAQFWIQQIWQQAWRTKGLNVDVVCPGFIPSTAAAHVGGVMHFVMRYLMPRCLLPRPSSKAPMFWPTGVCVI